jgi:hypothetical protein
VRLFAIVIMLSVLINPTSLRLGGPAPSPWFNEHVELKPVELPSGVSVTLAKNEYSKVPQEYIVIRNDSSTVLYIVAKPFSDMQFDESSAGLPEGTGLLRKIVNGRAFKWDFEWDETSSSYYYTWFDPEYGRENSIWVYVYGNQIETGDGLIAKLDPRNQFDGERPENVEVPEPQDAVFPILYGEKNIEIPITVFYTLNLDYRPASSNIGRNWIGDDIIFLLQAGCFALVLVILLFISVFSAWKYIKHSKK